MKYTKRGEGQGVFFSWDDGGQIARNVRRIHPLMNTCHCSFELKSCYVDALNTFKHYSINGNYFVSCWFFNLQRYVILNQPTHPPPHIFLEFRYSTLVWNGKWITRKHCFLFLYPITDMVLNQDMGWDGKGDSRKGKNRTFHRISIWNQLKIIFYVVR